MAVRRKHYKVQALPDELTSVVDRMISDGATYREIADILEAHGHQVGKSSVARYGKDFLGQIEKLKVVTGQVKAILADTEGLDVNAEEAASRVAVARIVEYMMTASDLSTEKFSSVVHALARLQTANVSREKMRVMSDGARRAAAAALKGELRAELKEHPELLARMVAMIEKKLESDESGQ
jgi:hypothetical protein